ncbi:hypothetical protein [Nannocystis pusilla]|uniref:hypothetical protein n=1 Tax=Nannocystis pusilla TaxID=889268 RepID=UPI003DA653C2
MKRSILLLTALTAAGAADATTAQAAPVEPSNIYGDTNLKVTKTAETTFTRVWTWTIEKVGDKNALTLPPGESHLVNYDVTVDATASDSYWAVSGTITIHNPAYVAATITSVTDVISQGIVADVDCGVSFPYSLGPGENLLCTYTADLPDGANRTNTATVTTYGPVGGGVGTAPVTFYGPTAEKDECVEVEDDKFGALGTVCAADAPKTFEYSMTVGPYHVCGPNEFKNTACFETNDTGTTGCDSHVVYIDVPCDAGCTLTQGYWKTHSHHGPAPEDATWFDLGDVDGDGMSEGADEDFFDSGQTWYEVLWTPPAGDPFYILAHQYIAAILNIENGASAPSEVDTALQQAEDYFNGQTLTKQQITALAKILDQYNNGLIGPGSCS